MRPLGLQAKMTGTYVLVTAAAVLVVEAVVIGVVTPRILSNQELAGRVKATARGSASKMSVQITESGGTRFGDLGIQGADVTPGTARPDKQGGVVIPQLNSRECNRSAPSSLAVLVSPSGRILATSFPGCYPVGGTRLPFTGLSLRSFASQGGRAMTPDGAVYWAADPVVRGVPSDGMPSAKPGPSDLYGSNSGGSTPPADHGKQLVGTMYVQVPADAAVPGGLARLGPLLWVALVLLLLTVPVGIVFGMLSTRRLIRRLRRLAGNTEAIASGDLGGRVPVTGEDEVAQLERSFNRMAERLDQARAAERQLVGANARLAERTRIARELHDSISQDLFSINMLAGGLRKALPANSGLRNEVESVERAASEAVQEMQALLLELRPMALEESGLVPALQELCRAYRERLGVTVVADLEAVELAPPVEHAVLRVAQEALANAVKHSGAAEVRLRLHTENGSVAVDVTDDGAGFDPETEGAPRSGLGLRLMRERVEELGGSIALHSGKGHGTSVRVLIPNRGAP